MKNQSGFSLIEVLIALLILSIGVMGAGKMLLESTKCYQRALLNAKATALAWSIAEAIRLDKRAIDSSQITHYWQEKLHAIYPGSLVSIQKHVIENRCTYTVIIQFAMPDIPPLALKIFV